MKYYIREDNRKAKKVTKKRYLEFQASCGIEDGKVRSAWWSPQGSGYVDSANNTTVAEEAHV